MICPVTLGMINGHSTVEDRDKLMELWHHHYGLELHDYVPSSLRCTQVSSE